MRLIQTAPPAAEPVTLADAKSFLRVDLPDDDPLISSLIVAARRAVETHLKQALVTQTWQLYLDSFPSAGGYYNRAIREVWPSLGGLPSGLGFYPGMVPNSTGVIDIPLPPLQAVASVQYYDFAGTLQTHPAENYNVSLGFQGRIQPAYGKVWPLSRPTIDSVLITFTAGYGDSAAAVPDTVLTAVKMQVSQWYRGRDASSVGAGFYAEIGQTVSDLLAVEDHGAYA